MIFSKYLIKDMKYEIIHFQYAIIIINYHTFYISKVINLKNKII